MKIRILSVSILLLICSALKGDYVIASAENLQKRVRFHVTAIGQSPNESKVLAETTIEGLPGTDFNINLQSGNFKMQARFLCDLISDDKLKVRSRFETRRFYGYSPVNLPLYEEDSQKHTLELGFDETIVLLPFGQNGGAETLKIEITPTLLAVPKNDDASRLTINFDKQIPNGEIAIEAVRVPHRFMVEAVLTADGRPVARGGADCLLEEEGEITLLPVANADADIADRPFKTRLTINKFIQNGPQSMIGVNFDFYRPKQDEADADRMIISAGAGIGPVGGDLVYAVQNAGLSAKTKYELRFRVRLVESEK